MCLCVLFFAFLHGSVKRSVNILKITMGNVVATSVQHSVVGFLDGCYEQS